MINLISYAVLAFSAVSLLGGAVYYIDSNATKRCEAKQAAKDEAQRKQAQEEITKIRNIYEKRLEKVYEAPDSDNGPVAPVLERVLDGLRDRHSTKQ